MDYAQEYLDRDGERLGIQVYSDPDGGAGDAPAVIVWPAMGVPARYYRPLARALHDNGLLVAVVDLRGTGTSAPPASRASRYAYPDLAADVGAVRDFLKPRLDGRPLLLLGHSLGGQACALNLALTGDADTAGLVLVGVGLPYWRDYTPVRGLMALAYTQAIAAVTAVLGFWPGWTFGGRQARGVIRDWAATARTGRFTRMEGVDVEAALARVRTPVLGVALVPDQYTPAGTVDRFLARFTAAAVTRIRYTPDEAGGPVDHFRWVRAGAALAERVAQFARDVRA